MEIVIRRDERECGNTVADVIDQTVRSGATTIGLATGSSPLSVYRELIRRHREDGLSFAGVQAFLLDEYVGLPPSHPQSYAHVIRVEFTDHVDIDSARVHGPDGIADDIFTAAEHYDASITQAGPVDVQLLGIGANGHIGFNEPGSSLGSRTRVKTLTEQTRHDNARFFSSIDEVPRHVITQGLGTISSARHLVLIATGEHKAEAVAAAVEGPVTASCPASVLQLHPHVTIVVDESAAAQLGNADFYRYALKYKPVQEKY
ncbi:glucosamine-6-phosphate deaminase [Mycobacterium sp. AZCC_0083]|uniref:glucosamine-6-phosphate deaminase n=1 Tax=Mycobacterium sp. AZCC_0083 TaxID=2735882 RepID=UPI0016073985|nr:glucosamine-6-phosphate deaminase [Mycobacterium sp. AZCC_0083]MBB5162960.1 glucosamine-6-phosphate deaminase [Mycobacterium sp. AZCC_0083]